MLQYIPIVDTLMKGKANTAHCLRFPGDWYGIKRHMFTFCCYILWTFRKLNIGSLTSASPYSKITFADIFGIWVTFDTVVLKMVVNAVLYSHNVLSWKLWKHVITNVPDVFLDVNLQYMLV